MVQISSKAMRIIKIVNIVLLLITIISLIITHMMFANRLTRKETIEKLNSIVNKDAYEFARFIASIGTGLGVGTRVYGIYATAQESFINCLIYGTALVVLLVCYLFSILRMSIFDVILHIVLIILAFVFAKLVAKEEPYSKEVATLPL